MEKFKAFVDKIIYRNEENGYTVLEASENGCESVCVGVFNYINEGEYMEFTGEFVMHPSYGEQFKIESYESIMPENVVAIERYLGSGAIKGIGPVMAKKIVDKFGEETLKIMDEEPERLAQIKGISMKKAQEIAAQQEEKKDIRKAMIFLGNLGISNVLAVKIYKQYQNAIYDIIRENPYKLADDITGVGFKKADEIAFRAGITPDSDFRIKSCIIYELTQGAQEGNVYLPEDILKARTLQTLMPFASDGPYEITEEDINRNLMDLAIEKRIIIKSTRSDEVLGDMSRQIYYSLYYYTEANIAKMLKDINLKGNISEEKIEARIEKIESESNIILDEKQKNAVKEAVNSGVLIMTGGPGTGKTTTINTIIKYFEEDYKEIVLAAPTGRAAKRMTEATGWEAKTLHRLLELASDIEDTSAGARFQRNEDYPLEADVIIVDEVSMVDIFLMNALLRAISPGTRLILVGDVDQLPSVGAGNVLKDLIDSECFKTVKLSKIFRQAEESDIVVNAHKINKGENIELKTNSKDFIFIKRENPNAVLSAVLGLVKDKLPSYVKTDIREIQVLAPTKKGTLGIEHLNKFLQENLNPADKSKTEIISGNEIFREGDKVMHIKNNYSLDWEMRTTGGFVYDKGTGVFNGDIGVIEKINEYTRLVEVHFDDGRYVIYDFEQLDELVLAYATTIHKAQGSEYPAIILPLISGPEMLMNRNILYTAVTRAKSCVCIVGTSEAVYKMIGNIRNTKRYSGLLDRLLELNGKVW